MTCLRLLLLLTVLSVGTLSVADVPEFINYQGFLKDSAQDPINGTVDLTFRFYDAETGGNLCLSVLQTGVNVSDGLCSLLIGSGTITPAKVDSLSGLFRSNDEVWMSVQVDTDGEMTPRVRISSAPYALEGSRRRSVTLLSLDTALTEHHEIVSVSGKVVLTLPPAGSATVGREYTIHNTGNAMVQIKAQASDTLEGITGGVLLLGQNMTLEVVGLTSTSWTATP